jgi:GNAT superfamily N-acetyltransferase
MEHDGEVVAITVYYHNGNNSAFVLTAINIWRFFYGLRRTIGVLIREFKIESVINPTGNDVVCIGHGGVLPNQQGLGLGAKLMNYLASLVRDAGCALASLDVTETNLTAH